MNKEKSSLLINGDEPVEMVYSKAEQKTQFAVYKDGQVNYQDKIEVGGEQIKPLSPQNEIVSKGVILFPSEATDYGSEESLVVEIQAFIHKYLDTSSFMEEIAPYYVLLSWAYDRFNEVPYLRAIGDYGSGKTRFLQVIGSICYKPIFAGGATTVSPIFRMLDSHRGTLVFDEADFRFSDKDADIIKILNNGYAKGFPVLRSEGKEGGSFEVKTFEVFSPKIIATRDKYKDRALESRFLVEQMGSREMRSDIPISLPKNFSNEALGLRNKLLYWRFKNYNNDFSREHVIERSIEPRLKQIILPLLSIIPSLEVRSSLTRFIEEYNNEIIVERSMSWEAETLMALLGCYNENGESPTIKQITEKHNFAQREQESLTSKKIGWIVRDKLKLFSYKSRDGFVVPLKENKEKIEILKKKYGVVDDVELMFREEEQIPF